ncbi:MULTISPECIES: biotin-dependent carboxyltransferase family protein [Paenibacillus]|uniref:5-oxoprolinase subunit C family protein n=1 Tax=Paenibacillus TaxID=44249 RepID=UPI001F267795|nr:MULTISPECIES: biotin-dependent carboxyltransferase family protein [Paenibacillus]
MSIRILKPGLLATVQDLGRTGFSRYGVILSGSVDDFALRTANWLAGNNAGAAALEITMSGFAAEFLEECLIAVTGGDMSPEIEGRPLPMWRPVAVAAGSRLTLRRPVYGCRTYVAVSGGLNVPPVMGSRSTYLRAGIGGFAGRPLRAGDVIPVGLPGPAKYGEAANREAANRGGERLSTAAPGAGQSAADSDSGAGVSSGTSGKEAEHGARSGVEVTAKADEALIRSMTRLPWKEPGADSATPGTGQGLDVESAAEQAAVPSLREHSLSGGFHAASWGISRSALPNYRESPVIRIIRGRQWEDFSPESLEDFLNGSYLVTPHSDRMGCRLSGPALRLKSPKEYLSEPVAHGTVQVPADGQPIVLLADRQTLGGYPKVAQVISVDLPLLAQAAPGTRIRFAEVSLREAETLLIRQERELKLLEMMIMLKRKECGYD